jgi:hypothetical protein
MSNPETVFRVVRQLGLPVTRTWLGLVAVDSDSGAFLAELESEISAQMDLPLRIVPCGGLGVHDLKHLLAQPDIDCVALIGLDNWGSEQWQDLDVNRNALDRPGPILFCLTPRAAEALGKFAPNVRSYLGSFHVIGPDQSGMAKEEVERHLDSLRTHYGLTDQQVIQKAQDGTLPPDAHFVEWLILLDRGDLV